MAEPLPPELEHMARQVCGSAKSLDVAGLVKQRAARQLQSYLNVLVLRLHKHRSSDESLQTDMDCMKFVQHLRSFQDAGNTETDSIQR
jgi:hypothetical protein